MSEKYPSSNSTGSFSTTTPNRAVFQEAKTYYVNYVEGLEASAASRKELLRRWNKHRVEVSHDDCPFCGAVVQVDTTPPPETIIVFTDNHTDECELAKALEQSEEELGDGKEINN